MGIPSILSTNCPYRAERRGQFTRHQARLLPGSCGDLPQPFFWPHQQPTFHSAAGIILPCFKLSATAQTWIIKSKLLSVACGPIRNWLVPHIRVYLPSHSLHCPCCHPTPSSVHAATTPPPVPRPHPPLPWDLRALFPLPSAQFMPSRL